MKKVLDKRQFNVIHSKLWGYWYCYCVSGEKCYLRFGSMRINRIKEIIK